MLPMLVCISPSFPPILSFTPSPVAVKRILREAQQLQQDPPTEFVAGPLEVCDPVLLHASPPD